MSYLAYLLYRLVSSAVALLPLPVAFAIGEFLGSIAWYLAWPYRRLVLHNLSIAFEGEKSPAELRRLARRHFALLGANLFSSFKIATMTSEDITTRVDIENMESLHIAANSSKGVVVILSHLGNWELLAHMVPHTPLDRRMGTVYQPLANRYLDRHVREIRIRDGLVPFDRRDGFREPIAFLRRGGGVGVLVDQHAGDGGIWTPFFGRLASTSPLAATMALRTGAPLLAMAVYTIGRARWRFVVSDPLPPDGGDIDQLTARINLMVEKEIRVSPADWFWVHDRWKTPHPQFLLSHYKRGVRLHPAMPASDLKPFRILIRSPNWLGDAVISAPSVRAIKAGRPDARVTILTPARIADFWKSMPEVDEVLSIEPSEGLVSVARKIGPRFDVAFVFPNSIRTGLEVLLAGVPRRIGYRRPWRGCAINDIVPDSPPGPITHQVHHYLELARHAGAHVTPGLIDPPAPPVASMASGPVRLGLVPGAEYGPAKRWMPESYAEVARRIAARTGAQWRIFGVAADRPAAEVIAARLNGQCENLTGQTTLAQLIERLRECRLLLTNDTGAMHLAAHFGVPVLAIFGSTEDRLTGPLGHSSRVLRHHSVCSPCFLRECPIDFRCMRSITVDEVTDAVLKELAGPQ